LVYNLCLGLAYGSKDVIFSAIVFYLLWDNDIFMPECGLQ